MPTIIADPLGVVVADDNRDHAESLASVITFWGHDSYVCLRPEKVLEDCLKYWPDLLLLDIGFPRRRDGLGVAKVVKRHSGTKQIVVAAISGFGDHITINEALDAGFDHYFVKPVDLDTLSSLLRCLHQKPIVAPGLQDIEHTHLMNKLGGITLSKVRIAKSGELE